MHNIPLFRIILYSFLFVVTHIMVGILWLPAGTQKYMCTGSQLHDNWLIHFVPNCLFTENWAPKPVFSSQSQVSVVLSWLTQLLLVSHLCKSHNTQFHNPTYFITKCTVTIYDIIYQVTSINTHVRARARITFSQYPNFQKLHLMFHPSNMASIYIT